MNPHSPLLFASLDLSRAPLMMALGLALAVFTWRMAGRVRGGGRLPLLAGALLLGLGYSVLLPLQESGLLNRGHEGHDHARVTDTAAWNMSRVAVMNLGWLLLGGGLALHVRSARKSLPVSSPQSTSPSSHESLA